MSGTEGTTITLFHAKGALRALAARYPDRTNNGRCAYIVDGQPNCIVGQALTDLGVDVEAVVEKASVNEPFRGWANGIIAPRLIEDYVDRKVTPKARHFLSQAQEIADSVGPDGLQGNKRWAEVVEEALNPQPESDLPF